jgi:DNA-binding response OmpR family regulator
MDVLILGKQRSMKARILWVEGGRADSSLYILGLRKHGYTVESVATGTEALERLVELEPDLIVVNTASMKTTGKRICQSLHRKSQRTPILVIAAGAGTLTNDQDVNVVLVLPFTLRKLLNRVKPLLPGDGANYIYRGPIRLDLQRRVVRCMGREESLTPRLVHLLTIFMEHSGEVLERSWLFREVWKTEYTADTRTLDVHISWLRQALEPDPRKPRFIKTSRGIGYRLDISPEKPVKS